MRARSWRGVPLYAAVLAVGCGAASDGGASAGEAAEYPSRPIEIVSWASPGGPTDLLARALARVGPRHFGQRMRVVTREGGAGAATMRYLSGKRGDGHVLAVFTASGAVSMAAGRIPFAPEDFTFLLRIQRDPFLLAVPAGSPHRDLRDFFDSARRRPGEISVSGFGAASAHFLAFERLRAAAGEPEVRWIPYAGSGDAVVASLGGHTDAVHSNYDIVREHVRAGTMRVLGVALPVEVLPGVASYAEQGYDVDPVHWRGVMAPPGLSEALADDIRARLEATVRDSEFVAYMERAEMRPAGMTGRAEFSAWVASEVDRARRMLALLELAEGAEPE